MRDPASCGRGPTKGGPQLKKSLSSRTLASTAALAIAMTATLSGTAHAQAAGAEDIVVTTQRNNETQVLGSGSLGALGVQDAMDTPFAVKSYSEALILNQQPYTLGQVLENDPSVRSSLGYGNASETFVIRGFPLYGEDIAIDGLFGITPRQLVSPELYDQVQILNGASSFLFGAAPGGSALGGTVNLMPKRAKAVPTTRVTANYLSGSNFGGSFDVGRRFGSDGALGVRVNGAGRWGDVAINDEYRGNTVLGLGLDYTTGALRLSLDLAYQRVKVSHMRPMVQLVGVTEVPDAPDSDLNYGQAWNYTTLRDIYGIAKIEYDVAEDFTLYASAGARDSAERGKYQGFNVTDAETGDAYVTGSQIPRNDNNEAAQAGLRGKFVTGPLTHQLNLGASHLRQVNRNAYGFGSFAGAPSNLYDPVQVPDFAYDAFTGGDIEDPFAMSKIRQSSLFASDQIGLFDDKVQLIAGLRHQNIEIRSFCGGSVFGGFPLDSCTPGEQTDKYDESATTPVFGLVLRPNEHVSVYANRIEALLQGPQAPSGTINSGEIFAPFAAVQYEIGGKLQYENWMASIAFYQTDRPQSFTITQDDGSTLFTLDGKQRNKGMEVTFNGEPVDGLRLIAGFAVSDAKQKRTQGGIYDGLRAIGVPTYTANANVEWDLAFVPGMTLTGRVMQTGKQYVDQANDLKVKDWTRFDLGARYVMAVNETPVTLRAGIDNVADKRYWSSALGGYLVQGLPRTFKASVTVEY
ncbi:TonB-dependent siderophore receptor [Novosphingobium sp. YJ-S2-02]|uniref:TonB-dependent siderophore receptor n=1 Tax=Novosphingobium aureum TaxID=2792964 RepID=A0A931HD26_9SPHN|nr:TonB-dependent siderophore receptor [Novosphingobium aureum]